MGVEDLLCSTAQLFNCSTALVPLDGTEQVSSRPQWSDYSGAGKGGIQDFPYVDEILNARFSQLTSNLNFHDLSALAECNCGQEWPQGQRPDDMRAIK